MSTRTSSFRVLRPLRDFLRAEAAGGVLLVAAAVVALVCLNSGIADAFERFWTTSTAITVGSHRLGLTLRGWVNEALMALFFLVAGLEIKRELVEGELRRWRNAALPLGAALGGMVVPAVLYLALNVGQSGAHGWGIPMATDIALAVGVLSLLGRRVPSGLSMFLLTLAIVDDLGAIIVIAVVYTDRVGVRWLLAAVAIVVAMAALRRLHVSLTAIYVGAGIALWLCLHAAHVHPTIAGVVVGLLTPTRPHLAPDLVDADALADVSSVDAARETVRIARASVSEVEWLEHRLHPLTSYVIVPLFALANAGVRLSTSALSDAGSSRVTWAVVVGLVVGKPLGIAASAWLLLRLRLARLPEGVGLRHIVGGGLLAGIGFTVATFIAEQALAPELLPQAKLGILLASIIAAVLGALWLLACSRDEQKDAIQPAGGKLGP